MLSCEGQCVHGYMSAATICWSDVDSSTVQCVCLCDKTRSVCVVLSPGVWRDLLDIWVVLRNTKIKENNNKKVEMRKNRKTNRGRKQRGRQRSRTKRKIN